MWPPSSRSSPRTGRVRRRRRVGPGSIWCGAPGQNPNSPRLISSAAHSVVVENEEMDSTSIEGALESDAERGVDVTVVMTADSDWDYGVLATRVRRGPRRALPRHGFCSVHPRQGDRRGQHEGLHRVGELLDGQPRLQPRVGPRHLGGKRSRAVEQRRSPATSRTDKLQPRPGTSAPATTTPPTAAPPATNPTTAGCTPIDNEGGCYEPGEYCRDDDHGTTGRAGDGQTITCEDENGTWYWEST